MFGITTEFKPSMLFATEKSGYILNLFFSLNFSLTSFSQFWKHNWGMVECW